MTLLELKEEIVKETIISDKADENGNSDIYVVPKEENEDFDFETEALCILSSTYVTDLGNGRFLIWDLDREERTITDEKGVVAYYKGWSDALCDYMFSAEEKMKHELYKKSYNETIISLATPRRDDDEEDLYKMRLN